VYNDDTLIPSLIDHGVAPESARCYANDGCSEVVIDGQSGIEFTHVEALKALELALFNGRENTLPGVPQGRYWTRHAPARRLRTALVLGCESGDVTQMTAPKFGNNDDRVDLLAADLAERFCQRVRSTPGPNGKPYWPALYDYL